tara:strand:+ start:101 stop:313 length:213 start_codon:yes stop_codon:yes gene_type:complete
MKSKFGLLSFLTLLGVSNFVLADAGDGLGCGMMYGSYGIGAMTFGWIFSLLVLIILVLLIVWLMKQIQKK